MPSHALALDECSYVCCAPLMLLLGWSFIISPSPAWSFDGSACKELGCIHPSDHALPSYRDLCPCSLASLPGIFIFLTLNTKAVPVLGLGFVYRVGPG